MPFNGTGVFTRIYNWVNDKNNSIAIRSDRMDAEMDGMAAGLTNCIAKDGQTQPLNNLPMNGFRHTIVGNAQGRQDYAAFGQLQDSAGQYGGNAGGSANALTINLTPPITAYSAGQVFRFYAIASNTGASTLAVNGLPAKNIMKTGNLMLAPGDITSAQLVQVFYDGTQFQLQSQTNNLSNLNGGALAGTRNRVINGDFAINQRGYNTGAGLAAGAYGHDRWKGGAGGCNYSFAQSLVGTQINITSGSLQQVIEDRAIEGGIYTMSWTGSAQGRFAGSGYAASPVTVGGLAAGTPYTLEFATGTLGQVQVEPGSVATPFERRLPALELTLCQRFYELVSQYMQGFSMDASQIICFFKFNVEKRIVPTIKITNSTPPAESPITVATRNTSGIGGVGGNYGNAFATTQGGRAILGGYTGMTAQQSAFVTPCFAADCEL